MNEPSTTIIKPKIDTTGYFHIPQTETQQILFELREIKKLLQALILK
jgi:hypothetical protein